MIKTKLQQFQEKYPDAKEYQQKNQSYVRSDVARIKTYGKDVPAKLLFERDLPSSNGVVQQFIFSEMALLAGS